MPDRPEWISLVEGGKLHHVGFAPSGVVTQVDLMVEKRAGAKRVTVWRLSRPAPLSARSALAVERALALREIAHFDPDTRDWTYPGKP